MKLTTDEFASLKTLVGLTCHECKEKVEHKAELVSEVDMTKGNVTIRHTKCHFAKMNRGK